MTHIVKVYRIEDHLRDYNSLFLDVMWVSRRKDKKIIHK